MKFWNWRQLTNGIKQWRLKALRMPALVDCLPLLCSRSTDWKLMNSWDSLTDPSSVVMRWLWTSNWGSLHPKTENQGKESHDMKKLTAYVTNNATNFQWQKTDLRRSFCAVWGIIIDFAFLPTCNGNQTNSMFITDPEKLSEAERRSPTIYILYKPIRSLQRKRTCWSCPSSAKVHFWYLSPFIGPNERLHGTGRTKQLRVAAFEVEYRFVGWLSPFSAFLLATFTQQTLPPRYWVSQSLALTQICLFQAENCFEINAV